MFFSVLVEKECKNGWMRRLMKNKPQINSFSRPCIHMKPACYSPENWAFQKHSSKWIHPGRTKKTVSKSLANNQVLPKIRKANTQRYVRQLQLLALLDFHGYYSYLQFLWCKTSLGICLSVIAPRLLTLSSKCRLNPCIINSSSWPSLLGGKSVPPHPPPHH